MKFHHLARHNHQFASTTHQQRELSPSKQALHQQLSRQQQQVTPATGGASSMSEDEADELEFATNEAQQQQQQQQQSFYEALEQQQQQQVNQPVDSSGFLIDKNKKLFPQKLWELIHNPSIQHCLRWSQDGQRVYLNRNEFEAYYLKTPNNQFHTQKAISFVRQMNMYGFRKVDDCYYENDNFRRDRQHLLRNMIRRHPNKGLFVGLDHHHLAAAAAAQQALQVNQQLQQLEHQHKHRTEQALRLNSYLNSHQFHQSAPHLAPHPSPASVAALSAKQAQQSHHHHHHHHQQQLHHSSISNAFSHMSPQLVQAAANHLSSQHQQQQQQQQQQLVGSKNNSTATSANVNLINSQPFPASTNMLHQPKKSRLLSNFYATNNNNININNNNNNNQDSMHSNSSSIDTQPSQCSSVVNSGSAGSPQPISPLNNVLQRTPINNNTSRHHSSSAKINHQFQHKQILESQLQKLSAHQHNGLSNSKSFALANQAIQNVATDLSSHSNSLASRQALHQTLVRSLLQLKQHPHELLASLQQQQQQQNPCSLLESLASLSSAGTGSIVDPTSNSPTERTSSSPSAPPSPALSRELTDFSIPNCYLDEANNIALDLAKSSSNGFNLNPHLDPEQDYPVDIADDSEEDEDDEIVAVHRRPADEGEETEIDEVGEDEDEDEDGENKSDDGTGDKTMNNQPDQLADSPLDVAKKVSRFLDAQMSIPEKATKAEYADDEDENCNLDDESNITLVKQEPLDSSSGKLKDKISRKRKRMSDFEEKTDDEKVDQDLADISSISKSLIMEICDRRGDQLDVPALQEAARYIECFLEILLDDAVLISKHSMASSPVNVTDDIEGNKDLKVNEDINNQDGKMIKLSEGSRRGSVVDTSSLSLALKLIPNKLLAAIQQQVVVSS